MRRETDERFFRLRKRKEKGSMKQTTLFWNEVPKRLIILHLLELTCSVVITSSNLNV